jgi:zinc transport system ATP-binding protein
MTTANPTPIHLEKVNFGYNHQALTIQNASLRVDEGDFVGIIGPNGGGKSTLLKLILGILQPASGLIQVFGQTPKQARNQIGYVPQHSTFIQQFPINVRDTVALGLLGLGSWFGGISTRERQGAMEILAKIGIDHLADRPISALSGGQLQRVLIARALISKPRLLLLDEPTASIDPHGEEDIFKILRTLSERLTIVVVSHDVGFVSSYVSKIACVSRTVVSHRPSEISPDTLARLYGPHVHAVIHQPHEHHS